MRLVVCVPTYNEKETIKDAIKNILTQEKNLGGIDLHVLVADSHSPDGTPDIVKKISQTNPKVHYLDVKERGLGVGLVKGHRFAIDKLKADILAQMDGDLSHDPSSLPEMVRLIEGGYDLVNGSRLVRGGKNLIGFHRRILTKGSSLVCQILWGNFKLSEFTNSYRIFTKELFEKINFDLIPWRAQTYIIQPAFLYAATQAGAKIKEVPITFTDRKNGYSKTKIINYTWDVIMFGLKVRLEKSQILIKFLLVGTIGYLVNAVALGLLNRGQIYSLKILAKPLFNFVPPESLAPKFFGISLDRLFWASVTSIELSIISNFLFHENWTYKSRKKEGFTLLRFLKFNVSSLASPLIQLISILFFARVLSVNEQIGLAVGVLIGLFFNYVINLVWIWKKD